MKPYVLLIEDDQWLAESYQSVLAANGYNVAVFSSAHMAMQEMENKLPDVIIADIMLGDHNTFTLFHELQSYADTATIPIIVCTGVDAGEFETVNLASYGIVSLLNKSTVTPEMLVSTVAEHLDIQKSGVSS